MKKEREEQEDEQISEPVEADPCCEAQVEVEAKVIVYGELLERCYETAKEVMEREGLLADTAIDYQIAENSHARQTRIALALFERVTRVVPAQEKIFSLGLEFLCLLVKEKEADRKRQEELREKISVMPTFDTSGLASVPQCKHPGLRILHDFWEAGQETKAPAMQIRSAATAGAIIDAMSIGKLPPDEDHARPDHLMLCSHCKAVFPVKHVKSGELWQCETDEEEAEEDEETEPKGRSSPLRCHEDDVEVEIEELSDDEEGDPVDAERPGKPYSEAPFVMPAPDDGAKAVIRGIGMEVARSLASSVCEHRGLKRLYLHAKHTEEVVRRAIGDVIYCMTHKGTDGEQYLFCSHCRSLFPVDAFEEGRLWDESAEASRKAAKEAETPEAGASFLRYMSAESKAFREAGPSVCEHPGLRMLHDQLSTDPGAALHGFRSEPGSAADAAQKIMDAMIEEQSMKYTYGALRCSHCQSLFPVDSVKSGKLWQEGNEGSPDWLKDDLKKSSFERLTDSVTEAVIEGRAFVGVYKSDLPGEPEYLCHFDGDELLKLGDYLKTHIRNNYGAGRYLFAVRDSEDRFVSDHFFRI